MQTIYLDISNKGVLPTIYAKQGDVGRKFLAVITDNGTIISGLQSPVFSVWYEGASGSGNYSAIDDRPAVVFDGKKAEVEMIAQMLVNAGKGQMTIVLNDALGKQIGLWNIEYYVEPVVGQGSEEAKDYYTALSETATRAIAAAERAESAVITTSVDSVDKITKNGYYELDVSVDGVTGRFACNAVVGGGEVRLTGSFGGGTLQHTKAGGWEWVDPPLLAGQEYHTTERYQGKPVYTQIVDCGTCPNNTGKSVRYSNENVTPIYCQGMVDAYYRGSFLGVFLASDTAFGGVQNSQISITACGAEVYVVTNMDRSDSTATAIVKYVKN